MSFSTLLELEGCPRRWALSKASYPEIWRGKGYPRIPSLAALRGSIVHSVISLIARSLPQKSQDDKPGSRVSEVLRDFGGFTRIIENLIREVLQQFSDNPRAQTNTKRIADQLIADIPELRLKSQELLARVNFDRYASLPIGLRRVNPPDASHHLTSGILSELEVRSVDLAWHGYIDLLSLSSDVCEIWDFKSGVRKEEHIFQLYVYALLWLRDTELNPNGRLATRLVLSYMDGDLEVPAPRPSEYPQIEAAIRERTAQALMSVRSVPPKAIVGSGNCDFCQVRHLCDEYWDAQLKRIPKLPIHKESRFIDMQVLIISPRGPASWDAKVESSYFALSGEPILVLDQTGSLMNFQAGKRIRLLSVRAIFDEYEAESAPRPLTVSFSSSSECFVLP